MNSNARISFSWNLLRYAYGLVVLLAGLDKLLGTNIIVMWPKYISPFVAGLLPVSTGAFLAAMGVVEVVVAILLLTKWPRIGAYLTTVWLLIISVNLVLLGALDIAIRDILLAVGAVVLAQLTGAVEEMKLTTATG
jgi:hypothetical protein